MAREIKVEFSDEPAPVHFINAFSVVKGTDDYFLKLGSVVPYLDSEVEKSGKIEISPLFVCAITKSSMKAFIELLQSEYEEDE